MTGSTALARGALALLAAAALAACPLPQSLPEYPKNSPVTPPRILDDSVTINGKTISGAPATVGAAIVPVPIACPAKPIYALDATLYDVNTFEQVEARWFVDYDPQLGTDAILSDETVQGSSDTTVLTRAPTPWSFSPYDYPPTVGPVCAKDTVIDGYHCAGMVHVVDLVVSNNFAGQGASAPLPNRSPASQFETQSYRWVFLFVDDPNLSCP